MYGLGDVFAFGFWLVNMLNIVDFPVFGNPKRVHCISAFFIPGFDDLPDFFLFSIPFFSFVYLVVKFFNIFSDDLCLGHSFIIISKHVILSSSVFASLNSCSAL